MPRRRPGLLWAAVAALAAMSGGCGGGDVGPSKSVVAVAAPSIPRSVTLADYNPDVAVRIAAARPTGPTLPDGTRSLLPGHRVVAFYGAAGAPGLGVLGTGSPDDVWPRLASQARGYRTPTSTVMPAFELITYLATASRGNQGNYSSRVPDRTIARYAKAAKQHHALLILDVQPGRGRFLADTKALKKWLLRPFVGLALDPEWKLHGGELPLRQIGHADAGSINAVSRWLNALTVAAGLPQKLMLVHQFTDDMVRHKAAVEARRHVAVVFNVDGFGSRAAKLGKYREFARDRRFPLGLKLFYSFDQGLLTPRQVLHVRPQPSVIEYE